MPLLDDSLSVWEIGFRWSGINPDALLYRIKTPPTAVKDTIRMVLRAIAHGDLYCSSLPCDPQLDSMLSDWHEQQWNLLDDVLDEGRYDREFLKRHTVWRWEFAQWCDKCGIPFPEFWFPSGWKTDEPGYPKALSIPSSDKGEAAHTDKTSAAEMATQKRPSEEAKEYAIQFAAKAREKLPLIKNPDIIEGLQRDKNFRAIAGREYSYKHILGWIRHLDPKLEKRKKRVSATRNTPEKDPDPLRQLERNQLKRNA